MEVFLHVQLYVIVLSHACQWKCRFQCFHTHVCAKCFHMCICEWMCMFQCFHTHASVCAFQVFLWVQNQIKNAASQSKLVKNKNKLCVTVKSMKTNTFQGKSLVLYICFVALAEMMIWYPCRLYNFIIKTSNNLYATLICLTCFAHPRMKQLQMWQNESVDM